MNPIGMQFLEPLSYEAFESFQYLLPYDFDYDDLEEAIKNQEIITLDMEDEEDRDEDIEVLNVLLEAYDPTATKYQLYRSEKQQWLPITIKEIA